MVAATKKNRIMREVLPDTTIDEIAQAVSSVLGKKIIHKASDSMYGEPRLWVPSGVPDLDLVLDRKHRGWPVGRIVELYGGPATTKTGLGYALIAQAQKLGGVGILYPCEGEFDRWLAARYGIDVDQLIVPEDPADLTVESVFKSFLAAMKRTGKRGLLVGMIDSIAAMCTNAELKDEDNFDRDRAAQVRALQISKAMRKLAAKMPQNNAILFCVNQTREVTDATLPTKPKPPGGQAIKFHASVRLRLETLQKVKRTRKGKDYVAGFKLRITAEKNRLATPFQEANIVLDYERGLQPMPKKKKKKP